MDRHYLEQPATMLAAADDLGDHPAKLAVEVGHLVGEAPARDDGDRDCVGLDLDSAERRQGDLQSGI